MASLALTIAAPALGLNGFALAAAGLGAALFDTYVVFPTLFGNPQTNITGPRIDDLRLTLASEGSPITFAAGPEAPIGGVVIWADELQEVKSTSEQGGKGGGGGAKSTTFSYFLSFSVLLPHALAGNVNAVRKIWFNDKVVYDASLLGEDKGSPVYINGSLQGSYGDKRYEGLRIYTGTQTTACPVIEAVEDPGATGNIVPPFKNFCYFTVDTLAVADWSNTVPSSIRALVEVDRGVTVGSTISRIVEFETGLDSDDYTIDAGLNAECLLGYFAVGEQEPAKMLDPLMVAYDVVAHETGGKIVFRKKTDYDLVTVPAGAVAAHGPGGSTARPFQIVESRPGGLPSRVEVRHVDVERDYEAGMQLARRGDIAQHSPLVIDLSQLSLDPDDAKAIAKRQLYQAIPAIQTVNAKLPPSLQGKVLEGFPISLTGYDQQFQVRVSEVTVGANGILDVTGVVESANAFVQTASAGSLPAPDANLPYIPPDLLWHVLDLPPLRDEDALSTPTYYLAVCAENPQDTYLGASFFRSFDGSSYDSITATGLESVIGNLVGTLSADKQPLVFDDNESINVEIYEGSLSSATHAQIMDGQNWLAVESGNGGWEVVAFKTATLQSTSSQGVKTYTLTGLVRGLLDTKHKMGSLTNASLVSLTTSDLTVANYDLADIDVSTFFKAVPLLSSLTEVSPQVKALKGTNLREYSPVNVAGTRDGSNNLTITWNRQTRAKVQTFGAEPLPILTGPEGYEVDIYDSTGTTLYRTITDLTSATASYTAAEQTADGATPGDSYLVKVFQTNDLVGRGNEGSATV